MLTHCSSLEMGLRCMKLQNPPLVHSLKVHVDTGSGRKQVVCHNTSSLPSSPPFTPCPSPSPHLILPTASLSEVGDRRQLSMYWEAIVPPVVQANDCLFCGLLILELHVHVHCMYTSIVHCTCTVCIYVHKRIHLCTKYTT